MVKEDIIKGRKVRDSFKSPYEELKFLRRTMKQILINNNIYDNEEYAEFKEYNESVEELVK